MKHMKPKPIPKQWQTFLWFAVLVLTLSYCTAEGCEDCEEPLPTEILSFTYTPNPVFVGDTVTFKVQIKDSLETGFEYYWSAGKGDYSENIGKILDGIKDSSRPELNKSLNWYRTTTPSNRWIATDDAMINVIIYNASRSKLYNGISPSITILKN